VQTKIRIQTGQKTGNIQLIYIYIVGFKINSSNWGFKRRKRSKGDLTKITIHVIMLQPMIDGNSC
jgi:hypothetical protein